MDGCIKCGATEDVALQVGNRCMYPIPCLTRQLASSRAQVVALQDKIDHYSEQAEAAAGEIAALKDAGAHCLCRADVYQLEQQVAKLTAELERWKAPLTFEQAAAVLPECDELFDEGDVDEIDAAIRAVREAGENT